MPTIDFYIIPAGTPQASLHFACRLLEKAYQQNHQIYVHTDSAETAQILDNLLWTFKEDSFIPHELQSGNPETEAPIQIGQGTPSHSDILLNLHPEIPPFHHQFNRILEIIPNQPDFMELSEKHRVFYEEKGYKISLHQLTK